MWSSETVEGAATGRERRKVELYPFVERTKAKLDSLVSKIVRRKRGTSSRVNNEPGSGFGSDGYGLTTRGASLALAELNAQQLRSIKLIVQNCGKEAANYCCYVLYDKGFKSDNSLERYLSLLLLKELLSKSHYVRQYVFGDFIIFVKHIVNIPNVSKLPGPEATALILHKKALILIRDWCSNYGDYYGKLNIAAKYLESQLPEFYDTSKRALSRREREEEERRQRTQRILRVQLDNLRRDLRDNVDDDTGTSQNGGALVAMKATLTEAEELLEILVPSVSALTEYSKHIIKPSVGSVEESDDDSILWDDDDDDNGETESISKSNPQGTSSNDLNTVAHIPSNYELVINIPVGGESCKHSSFFSKRQGLSPESEAVVRESLLDCRKEIQKSHLPLIESWIRILSRVEPDTTDRRRTRSRLLVNVLGLKSKFRGIAQKCNDVGVVLGNEDNVKGTGINIYVDDYVQLVSNNYALNSVSTITGPNNATRKRKSDSTVELVKPKFLKNLKEKKKEKKLALEKRKIVKEDNDGKPSLNLKEKRSNKRKGKLKRQFADPFKR
uniref:VHS domain-containing protein n=2 Tax=Aplanochytrium stocchinoi TaxID=215587 RepID=A0A6S8CP36_9STRA|mmetsp:Transcript_18033/g.22190  ORF Transcript_18033/g.22190 Transcript_18033/m.22190 type:complete len:557 (-) Transcript_18033:821-2491(-)|eukprot:CAMPEP_0204843358 /NCGR_PEP_ID=MMETSP1346-20131115/47933_1 /ASSEMBLY_ACC=CAM_ASM_000771 /TAXON_ID=215587 /ORGANISM="Aplanochytrium stocchinoi, Strain GSBS06" /LENGTH=556 /DNA_ID=CAMNT_0051982489 /DNA_START=263 /DNA_END=1933 /DNA_ORIENTATION=+